MLIKNAELAGSTITDVRIDEDRITALGQLCKRPDEPVLEAHGRALIPGLNDHHIHFLGFAASLASLNCGPDCFQTREQLGEALKQRINNEHPEWIRGYGYHESVAGDIDRHWLDQICGDSPTRIQHRSGRLWILNSAALEQVQLGLEKQPQLDRDTLRNSMQSGRFYDLDQELGKLLGRTLPPVLPASRMLASYGVTGFCDMTPSNNPEQLNLFQQLQGSNRILQTVLMAGNATLSSGNEGAISAKLEHKRLAVGPTKAHLHETHLPELDQFAAQIRASHQQNRAVAVHCVTEVELMFTLAAFDEAGTVPGDRLEHASMTPDHCLDRILELGLIVVTQPHFIPERGDAYLQDIPAQEHPALYRCQSFLQHGIPLAAGSDAPFGQASPWRSMNSATRRLTRSGAVLGAAEALSAHQALALYTGPLHQPTAATELKPGVIADLCLLNSPWKDASHNLADVRVDMTIARGNVIFRR